MIGLYMLARYLRMHPSAYFRSNRFSFNLMAFITLIIVNCCVAIIGVRLNESALTSRIAISYTNPLTILSGIYFLLFFSNLRFHSTCINWIAKSCFAVLLTHLIFFLVDYYKMIVSATYSKYSNITFMCVICAVLVGIFFTSVIIDKLRLFIICPNKQGNIYSAMRICMPKFAKATQHLLIL